MDIKKQVGYGNSINIQGENINFNTNNSSAIINLSSKLPLIYDILYSNTNRWDQAVDNIKNILKTDNILPYDLLNFSTTFAIASIRYEADSRHPLIFIDTSWISHTEDFWNTDPLMIHWLNKLGEISLVRRKKNLKTFRVFFWEPQKITEEIQLIQLSTTIIKHLQYGICVILIDKNYDFIPLDVHVYSNSNGLYSDDFTNFDIKGLYDSDKISEFIGMVLKLSSLHQLKNDPIIVFNNEQIEIKAINNKLKVYW